MMLCQKPVIVAGRAVLSASDAVWTPIKHVPSGIDGITDDLGGLEPTYAGTVFVHGDAAIERLHQIGVMICMRCVRAVDRVYTDCPIGISIDAMNPKPLFMGWDVVRGNGWVSASCDGCFPTDSDGLLRPGENAGALNDYSLLERLVDCLAYCSRSNVEVPQWAPWYPVAVYCDYWSKAEVDRLIR
jgi:hypothetical protein